MKDMIRKLSLLCISIIALAGCFLKQKSYTIGIDPSWFPLDLQGRDARLLAFSHDLLSEISRLERIHFREVTRSWDNLDLGLKEKKYDAILASIYPHVYEQARYSFSDLYMHTGPVLVVKNQARLGLSNTLADREIALHSQDIQTLLIQLYPQATFRFYSTLPAVLDALLNDLVDAAAMGRLLAIFYIQHLYKEKVKMITPPLNDAGLRLITLRGQQNGLIRAFNRGLAHVRKSGTYDALIKKWGLDWE